MQFKTPSPHWSANPNFGRQGKELKLVKDKPRRRRQRHTDTYDDPDPYRQPAKTYKVERY